MPEDEQPIKYMTIEEFRKSGYLFELNRLYLHPLGLALEVVRKAGEPDRLGGIWDYRDDPEGIFFDDIDDEDRQRAAFVAAQEVMRYQPRVAALGYWVQPLVAS